MDATMQSVFPVGCFRTVHGVDGTIYHATISKHGDGELVLIGARVWTPGTSMPTSPRTPVRVAYDLITTGNPGPLVCGEIGCKNTAVRVLRIPGLPATTELHRCEKHSPR